MEHWTGDPVEDFEIAKRLIAKHPHVDVAGLLSTAADHSALHSARLASIWALGFTDDTSLSRTALARIADDADEPEDLRDHAAEALTSIAPSN